MEEKLTEKLTLTETDAKDIIPLSPSPSSPPPSSLPKVMKAVVFDGYGEPDDKIRFVQNHPIPVVGNSDVLIRVHAASLNPIDYKILHGYLWLLKMAQTWPFIPGHDVSGVVVHTGSHCKRIKTGDKVYSMATFLRCGTLAEYVSIQEEFVSLKPTNLTFEEAATLPLAGLTSFQALIDSSHLKKSEKVLINGGAGGTGSFGIQLAQYLGAEVAVTCSQRNVELVTRLGADHIIDYQKEDVGVALKGKNYDVVYDTVGGQEIWNKSMNDILSPSGRFVTIAGDKQAPIDPISGISTGAKVVNRGFWNLIGQAPSYSMVLCKSNALQLDQIRKIVEEGSIKPIIEKTYPLESSLDAFKHLMTGRVSGKLAISVFEPQSI